MIAVRILAVLAVALCAAHAPAQEDLEQRLDAVREFQRYFKKFKDVNQKVEAVFTLKGNECVPAADALVELFDYKMPEVARAAVDVLATFEQEATFSALIASLPELDSDERRAVLVEVLGRANIKGAADTIAGLVLDVKRPHGEGVRFQVARALGRLRGERASAALELLLDDKDPTVRMAACDSVGILDLEALGQKLIPLIDDSSWQVQVAAVQAVGRVRVAAAVDPLIELMAKGGRVVEECADALFNITAIDLGTDVDSWRSTWGRLKAIEGWRIPTDEELRQKAESRKRYDALYGKVDKATTFGGIKTTSTRILFIIDISGSMEDLVVQREKFDADYADFQKLTIVKTELERTIETLDEHTLFNIVAFATEVDTWKKFLVPGNVVNKASAATFVKRLKALGGKEAQGLAGAGLGGTANLGVGKTNTHAALLYPFGIDPEDARSYEKADPNKNKLDTVFFLSDGRPSTGKVVDEQEILREITEVNDKFRIVFHVITIGEFQKEFLKSLAELNGGVFVDLGH